MPIVKESEQYPWPKKLSRRGAKFIAHFEGGADDDGRFRPYYDELGGVWTQGFGHTRDVNLSKWNRKRGWSRRKALRVLRKDAAPLVKLIRDAWGGKRPLKKDQVDALVSFGFNLGPGYFLPGYSIGNALHSGRVVHVADAILLYNKAGDPPKPVEGLTRRRRAESKLFLHPQR